MTERYENSALHIAFLSKYCGQRQHAVRCPLSVCKEKIFSTFLKSPDLCKEVAKVGLLYSNHSQGEKPRLDRKTQNLLKKIQNFFQKPENLQRTCKDHPDIIKPQ